MSSKKEKERLKELEKRAKADGRKKPTKEWLVKFYDDLRKIRPNIYYDHIMKITDLYLENWMPPTRTLDNVFQHIPKGPLVKPFVVNSFDPKIPVDKAGNIPFNPKNNLFTPHDLTCKVLIGSAQGAKQAVSGVVWGHPGQMIEPWPANKEEIYFVIEGKITIFYRSKGEKNYKSFDMNKNDMALLPAHYEYLVENTGDTICFYLWVLMPLRYPGG